MAEWKNPKTDWVTNPKNPVAEDFNRIEGNIDFLKQDIETKKGIIVNALNTVGLDTELTDTHAQIANKITDANQGTKVITPGTSNITIPKGFHSGQGYVVGDSNLVPENIVIGKSIFGVAGNAVKGEFYSTFKSYMSASGETITFPFSPDVVAIKGNTTSSPSYELAGCKTIDGVTGYPSYDDYSVTIDFIEPDEVFFQFREYVSGIGWRGRDMRDVTFYGYKCR